MWPNGKRDNTTQQYMLQVNPSEMVPLPFSRSFPLQTVRRGKGETLRALVGTTEGWLRKRQQACKARGDKSTALTCSAAFSVDRRMGTTVSVMILSDKAQDQQTQPEQGSPPFCWLPGRRMTGPVRSNVRGSMTSPAPFWECSELFTWKCSEQRSNFVVATCHTSEKRCSTHKKKKRKDLLTRAWNQQQLKQKIMYVCIKIGMIIS